MARPAPRSDAAPSPRATLTLEEEGARHTFHLDHAVTVGRDPACDVLLSSPTVSRRHALVFPDGEGWTVRDLGSGNGTFLDARRVDEAPLPNGVALLLGATFWHRGCSARGAGPDSAVQAATPVAGSTERPG